MRLRALIYARVSTESQEENESLKFQILKSQDFCKLKEFDIYKIIDDVGSGGTTARAGYQKLLEEIERHSFDVLVVYEISRIARNTRELLNFVNKLNTKGIKFSSISQPDLDTTTPTGNLFFNIQASLSESERQWTSVRVKSNKKQRAKEGRWQGGFLPLGYKKDDENNIVVDEEKAKLVRKFFEEYVNGESAKKISEKYKINLSSLFYILGNKFYLGKIPYGRRENNITTNQIIVHKTFKYTFEGNHQPIIDENTFKLASERIQKRRRPAKSNTEILIFSGLVICECGNRMYKNTTRGYHSYKCEKCKKSISEIKLNQKIIETLFKITELQKLNETKKENKTKEFQEKINNLQKEKMDLEKEQKEALKLLIKKIISEKEYKEVAEEIKFKIEIIDNDILKFEKLKQIEDSKFYKSDNIELLRSIILNIDDTDKKELNEIFKMLISEIKIYDNKKMDIEIKLGI